MTIHQSIFYSLRIGSLAHTPKDFHPHELSKTSCNIWLHISTRNKLRLFFSMAFNCHFSYHQININLAYVTMCMIYFICAEREAVVPSWTSEEIETAVTGESFFMVLL